MTKLRNKGHPSMRYLLLTSGGHLVHDKKLLPGTSVQDILHVCVGVLACACYTQDWQHLHTQDSIE